ncbi:MAG: hypothetical protein HY298_13460 [Verrucomicrobia bacterium]|nr:hypothetical protein [Verrucomicrobiota bacterium]
MFRWFRISVLLVLLGVIIAAIYLNQVGIPNIIKRPLLEELRARGVELQFDRLRLRWYRGIVAENVHFGAANQPQGPQFSLAEVEVRINMAALKKRRLQVDSLLLHQGRLIWPLTDTNQPPQKLFLDNIQTELRFLPNDQWELDKFQAHFAGAKMQLAGTLTNASAVRDWTFLRTGRPANREVMQNRLRQLVNTLEAITYASPPELQLAVRGDARDLDSFNGNLILRAPGAETPWGQFRNGLFSVKLLPATASNELHQAELSLRAADAETRWGTNQNLQLDVHLVSARDNTNLVQADLKLLAGPIGTAWVQADAVQFTAHWTHAITNAIPLSGQGELQLAGVETRWGKTKRTRIVGRLAPPGTNAPPRTDESWALWADLAPFALDWEAQISGVESPELSVQEIVCQGNWRAPELTVTNLHTELYQGQLDARAEVNVATRELTANASSDFDVHKISPLLTEKGREWLSRYSWEKPPQAHGQVFVVLPAWTNHQPDWRKDVQPTLRLQGEFSAGHGAYSNVPVTSARSHFTYSNEVWNLPDLVATRPDGKLELAHIADDRTHNYYFRVHSTIDVKALRPLLEEKEQRAFDQIEFTTTPVVDGEIWGRWHAVELIGFKGRVACSNFTFRGETATRLQSALQFTNKFLTLTEARVERAAEYLTATSVGIDFTERKVFLTNGFSVMDPMVVTRAIGPKTAHAVEPYRFLKSPTVRVNGVIPIDDIETVDLHFDVDGGPFQWWKFNVPQIAGSVDWVGQTLTLTNMQAAFYGGHAAGDAAFQFARGQGTEFGFDVTVTNASLQQLMADLSPRTNHLEGTLKGHLTITNANSDNWESWQGSGKVRLRDGLIWDIPVFGIFSSMLNLLWPGLGNSRASDGVATFTITNSVIHSDDLEIRSTGFRMQYQGDVDFKGRVDARMEAELLRDFPGLGRVLSLALLPVTKIFEFKVTGTLSDPKSEPLYLPNFFLMPLHPLQSLKELFSPEPAKPFAPPPEKNQ